MFSLVQATTLAVAGSTKSWVTEVNRMGVHVLGFHAGLLHGDLPRSGGDVGAQLVLGRPMAGGTAGEHLAQAELHAVVFVSGHLSSSRW